MNKAYQQSFSKNDQNSWMSEKKKLLPQVLYWCTVTELEILLLSLIKSLRTLTFPCSLAVWKRLLLECSQWIIAVMLVGCLSLYMISNRYSLMTQEYTKSSGKESLRSTKEESHFPVLV